MAKPYIPGLNALRFFAAGLVVLFHIHINQAKVDLPTLPDWPIFFKGEEAVQFFFTLSGFLITLLLIHEHHETGRIHLKNFYRRRALRIWPLYYLVVAVGLWVYFWLLPTLGIAYEGMTVDFRTGLGAYLLFLPNLVYAYYHVGGIIGITWSIGVEEQYYVVWAPLVQRLFPRLLRLLWIVFGLIALLQTANQLHWLDVSDGTRKLIRTFQVHYMAAGGLLAYAYSHHRVWLRSVPWIRDHRLRAVLMCLLLGFLTGYRSGIPYWLVNICLPFLYTWLIAVVALYPSSPRRGLRHPWLDWLGQISYGIYMYHYGFVYLASYLFSQFGWLVNTPWLYQGAYHILVLGGTIASAHFSYIWLERWFLQQKKRFA